MGARRPTQRQSRGRVSCGTKRRVVITAPLASAILFVGVAYTISGTCDAGATVDVTVDGVSVGAATVVGSGWTRAWTPSAGQEGTPSIVATQTLGGTAASLAVTPAVINAFFAIDASDPASYTGSPTLTALVNQVTGVSMSTVVGTPTIATDAVTGLAYFSFDGASYVIGTEAAVLSAVSGVDKAHTCWCVIERSALSASNSEYWAAALSTNTGSALEFLESADIYFVEKLGNPAGPARDWNSQTVQEGLTRLMFRSADGLTWFNSVDGGTEGSETLTSPGTILPDRFSVGCLPRNTPTLFMIGRIHQIIICAANKSAAILSAIDSRLAAKWRRPGVVSFLGDSLTRVTPYAPAGGWRKSVYDWAVTNGKRLDFQGRIADGSGLVDNRHNGIAGNTMAQISTRAATYYGTGGLQRNTQLVTLLTGTNDAGLGTATAWSQYAALLEQIHTALVTTVPTARIAVTTIPPIQSSSWPADFNAGLPALWNAFDAAHPANKLLRWDAYNALGGAWSAPLFGADTTHPNETGSQLMATDPTYGLLAAIGPYLSTIG